jgi:hypothetical protein
LTLLSSRTFQWREIANPISAIRTATTMSMNIEPFLVVVLGQIYKKGGAAAIVWRANKSYLIVLMNVINFSNLVHFHPETTGPEAGINPN